MTMTFLSWVDFKAATPSALPRYFAVRGKTGILNSAVGVAAAGVNHVYTPLNDEEIICEGVGADLWFSGAVKVDVFTS